MMNQSQHWHSPALRAPQRESVPPPFHAKKRKTNEAQRKKLDDEKKQTKEERDKRVNQRPDRRP
jgi:hypothetical protein